MYAFSRLCDHPFVALIVRRLCDLVTFDWLTFKIMFGVSLAVGKLWTKLKLSVVLYSWCSWFIRPDGVRRWTMMFWSSECFNCASLWRKHLLPVWKWYDHWFVHLVLWWSWPLSRHRVSILCTLPFLFRGRHRDWLLMPLWWPYASCDLFRMMPFGTSFCLSVDHGVELSYNDKNDFWLTCPNYVQILFKTNELLLILTWWDKHDVAGPSEQLGECLWDREWLPVTLCIVFEKSTCIMPCCIFVIFFGFNFLFCDHISILYVQVSLLLFLWVFYLHFIL